MTTSAYAYEIGEHLPTEAVQESAEQLRDLLTAQIEGDKEAELTILLEDERQEQLVLAPDCLSNCSDICKKAMALPLFPSPSS